MTQLDLDQLADRHFRPDPQGILAPPASAKSGRILIAIESRMAETKAGQDALWMLANLLCRQFKLVAGITLDVPPLVALLPRVAPFGDAATIKETIANCVRQVAGTHVVLADIADDPSAQHDIEIFVGRPGEPSRAAVRLVLFADGWRIYLGKSSKVPDLLPQSSVTIGPYMAACFAAGEVFKRLRVMKVGKGEFIGDPTDLFLSVWSGQKATSWNALEDGPEDVSFAFPPFYFAGAGAVAEAAALALTGIPDATGYATTIDPDSLDLTNDNRYSISTLGDDKEPKAAFLADFLKSRGFGQYSYPGPWQQYINRQGRNPNRPDLAVLERNYRYRLILSCVDDNGARHAIQNVWPDMIIGGSTFGLVAKATTYDMRGEQLCLKCYNPVIDRNVLVRERLKQAHAMNDKERAELFRSLDLDPARANAHLHNPECGQLSEADLDRFARGEPMMSVGFVSVASGVLLAAQLVRLIHSGREAVVARGATLMANFYRPNLRWLRTLPENGCDCREQRESAWRKQWAQDSAGRS
jgi:molybdopterin/thiamine biosynthesis adenylyltransferase